MSICSCLNLLPWTVYSELFNHHDTLKSAVWQTTRWHLAWHFAYQLAGLQRKLLGWWWILQYVTGSPKNPHYSGYKIRLTMVFPSIYGSADQTGFSSVPKFRLFYARLDAISSCSCYGNCRQTGNRACDCVNLVLFFKRLSFKRQEMCTALEPGLLNAEQLHLQWQH